MPLLLLVGQQQPVAALPRFELKRAAALPRLELEPAAALPRLELGAIAALPQLELELVAALPFGVGPTDVLRFGVEPTAVLLFGLEQIAVLLCKEPADWIWWKTVWVQRCWLNRKRCSASKRRRDTRQLGCSPRRPV